MKKSSFTTFIFDLDGVITETSEYHYKAWKIVCDKIGYNLTRKKNEELKGVNRKKCLDLIMQWSNTKLSEKQIKILLEEKNNIYKDFIKNLNEKDVCEGVLNFIHEAIKENINIALYSASRNAKKILTQLNIIDLFSVIIDGNNVSNSKPDPEGFKKAVNNFELASLKLIDNSKEKDFEKTVDSFRDLAGTCKGCHQKFRN